MVMPSMTDDDEHIFEPERTPCLGMGVVADTFWRLPGGMLRSDSPHAFARRQGAVCSQYTAPQPADIHGIDSPVGRISVLDGRTFTGYWSHCKYNHPPGRIYVRCAVQAQEISSYSERCTKHAWIMLRLTTAARISIWLMAGLMKKAYKAQRTSRQCRCSSCPFADILRVVIRQPVQTRSFSYIPQVLMNNVMKPGVYELSNP